MEKFKGLKYVMILLKWVMLLQIAHINKKIVLKIFHLYGKGELKRIKTLKTSL